MEKLIDVLSKIDPEQIVHIGSKSSFFDIREAKSLINKIDELSKTLYEEFLNREDEHIRKLELLIKNAPIIDGNNIDEYIECLHEWVKKIDKAILTLEYDNRNVLSFESLRERNVKEVYDRITGDGVCIIVTGNETEKYWIIDEKHQHFCNAGKSE